MTGILPVCVAMMRKELYKSWLGRRPFNPSKFLVKTLDEKQTDDTYHGKRQGERMSDQGSQYSERSKSHRMTMIKIRSGDLHG